MNPSSSDDIAALFSLARSAQRRWQAIPILERTRRLQKVGDRLLERLDALAELIHDENGKPLVEAIAHAVGASASKVRHLCKMAPRWLKPEKVCIKWMPNRVATIQRQPFGLVVVISPWNMPLTIPLGQVLAGLLAGNAVVLKPSEVTPTSGDALRDLFDECDLHPHLFSVVQGDGAVGAQLIAARPDKVFFTGSVATGKKVMAGAAAFPIPVCLELGGVDAMIVCDDADLDYATSAALWGATFNGGQVCASVERLLLHRSIRQPFVDLLLQKIGRLNVDTDLGRITMSGGVAEYIEGEKIEDLIERADAALYTAKHNGRNQISAAPAPGQKKATA